MLANRLVLHRFVCQEFGYDDMSDILARLRDAPTELGVGSESEYACALYLSPARAKVTSDQFSTYDENIVAHSHKLRMTGEHGRGWKPHQYLALLFTEHYLSRYFSDSEALCADLNEAKRENQLAHAMPDYTQDDLRTIAFQSATGSGKTLIMHAHVLQYQHYLKCSGGRLNNIILLTPNEQMSGQHEREMRESGLRARLFSADVNADLFSHIEIIDLNKLAEKKGIKRVAVGDFGDNNLVLVDEGHLGASGKVWRERRKELSRGGFTFEYSATFNQIVKRDTELLNAYGKSLLFDYAYRQFHKDGYGKDYIISNLPKGMEDANSNMYLLGCLLTFYQQCRIWRDKGAEWTNFNLAKPLWVFLGKTVTGSSNADQEAKSDVVRILDFIGWVLAHAEQARPMIDCLLAGESGLTDNAGHDFFTGRFGQLESGHSGNIYTDICETLFHGQGKLHVRYLTSGEGELHLRTADNVPFGVVNVGDSAALYKLLADTANPDIDIERETGFAKRLFADVDRSDSMVNIVIGARRFIAGWNSWRVSTMGLMHVGVGEGPEIIQMFGRGVRLKGWNMSLKRHRESGAELPVDSVDLAALETLHIFGLRANYMQAFQDLLKREGISVEREVVPLPVTWNFAKKNLKLIRLKEHLKYKSSDKRPVLPGPDAKNHPRVTLDMYSRLQSVSSDDGVIGRMKKNSVKLHPKHVAFFDRTRIYDKLLIRKRQKEWHNLVIEPETVGRLLESDEWYDLYAPPELLSVTEFQRVYALEDVAIDLITEYADQFWRRERRQWEHDKIEVVTLDENDPNNIGAYELLVDATQTELIKDVHELAAYVQERDYHRLKLGVILPDVHAYKPLLYAGKDCKVTVQPVPLDENEKKVVEKLAALAKNGDPRLHNRELFLIRNLTRSRGVSFFDDFGYYPDFIVWLKSSDEQHVVFLDPKGLVRYGRRAREKVRLHAGIKEVENQVRETDPDIHLHAYVLSVTSPGEIGDELRSQNEWEQKGVYFLNDDPDCLGRVIEHALGQ